MVVGVGVLAVVVLVTAVVAVQVARGEWRVAVAVVCGSTSGGGSSSSRRSISSCCWRGISSNS